MINFDLFDQVKNDLSLGITIDQDSNLSTGKILLSDKQVGYIRKTDIGVEFSVGADEYTVTPIKNGIQVNKVVILDHAINYISAPDYFRLHYKGRDEELLVMDIQDTLNIKLITPTKENDSYVSNNSLDYTKQDRRIKLVSNESGIIYLFEEMYHTGDYSSGPSWTYGIDSIERKLDNYWKKGQNLIDSSLNGNDEIVRSLISENLIKNKTFEDMQTMEHIGNTELIKRLSLKVNKALMR